MNSKNENALFLPIFLLRALPSAVILDFEQVCEKTHLRAEEIRLRADRLTDFSFSGTSILGESKVSGEEIKEIFYRLCGGSVYAHADTVRKGYIRGAGGVRIGVCGRASQTGEIYDISSLNIRLPGSFLPNVNELSDLFLEPIGGMLVLSPPGVGKTTVLRALAREISGRCGKRVAVVDTRSELSLGLDGDDLRIDILDGYPRGEGIEIAVRTLNPDVIICDEIGSTEEAKALLSAQNCGVSVIASAHGESAEGIVKRSGISELHSAGIFKNYVILQRARESTVCSWTITERESVGNSDV
ncbi:MAG: AAA family ATPase [Ruminococcaceae bacterium]|nr:AAA family ATPase [Oscillospiraceae bacterium]